MTPAEIIVLAIIRAETAARGFCIYEGIAERLLVYLDADELESFLGIQRH